MYRNDLLESENYPGFYHHPAIDHIVVSKDGKLFLFGSISDVSRTFDVSLYKLYSALSGGKPKMDIVICYLDECDDEVNGVEIMPVYKSSIVRPNFKRKPEPIVVENLITGETVHWDSVGDFATSECISKSAIQRSVWKNAGRWRNFKVTYINKSVTSETV